MQNTHKSSTEKTMSRTRILALAKEIGSLGPSIGASLTEVRRKCGKRNCRCATEPDALHSAFMLCWKEEGRSRAVHVPRDMVEEAKLWINTRRKLKELLKEMDAQVLELLKNREAPAPIPRSGNARGRPPKKT
jgi:hypothetical protein